MKILLISGFLGAGKTTFIKAMAKATGREFVIVENEFADQDVDSQILSQDEATEKMEIWELAEGCICCSLNLDFSFSVMTIANTLNPDYLIVEPSGVAQPTKIIESLEKIEYEKISLLAPITIIDSDNYLSQKQEFANYFDDQLISAGTLVLSKSENLARDTFSEIANFLEVPQDVNFPTQHYSKWSKEDWLSLLNTDFSGEDIKRIGDRFTARQIARKADLDLKSLTLDNPKFINIDELYFFMNSILNGKYGRIVRAKGFITINDETVHVELVQNKFTIIGLGNFNMNKLPDEYFTDDHLAEEKSEKTKFSNNRIIVIGKNIKKTKLLEIAN